MPRSGVTVRTPMAVGREPESQYGEAIAGVRRGETNPPVHYGQKDKDHFVAAMDPFVKPGAPTSGLLQAKLEAPASGEKVRSRESRAMSRRE